MKKKDTDEPAASLLDYYRQNRFNPVPIALEDKTAWESHCAKRLNLYQRHLGIPLSLLRDRSVVEFGCGSGENALVLASVGARLTLVEPNEQVLPQLKALFKKFGLESRIAAFLTQDINSFESETTYDIVLAEGFLYTLPNRDEIILKIGHLLAPGGLAVISFNDRYGGLLEMTKRLLLWRACRLADVDVHSEASRELAEKLFGRDFARLNASRPFSAWWKDTLVNPLYTSQYLWSYPEVLPPVAQAGGEFYASSPRWSFSDHFTWYKNMPDNETRRQRLLDDWAMAFPYFLTGLPLSGSGNEPATSKVIKAVSKLVARISEYTASADCPIDTVVYPPELDDYLEKSGDSGTRRFNSEMKKLYQTISTGSLDDLVDNYHGTELVRNLWGVPYHYLCFSKISQSGFIRSQRETG